jgi:hypothetical protein
MTTVQYNGRTGTLDQIHAAQTPAEIYADSIRRMEYLAPNTAEYERLVNRWPTLGDCYRAMTEAYAKLSPAEQAADAADAEKELAFASAW